MKGPLEQHLELVVVEGLPPVESVDTRWLPGTEADSSRLLVIEFYKGTHADDRNTVIQRLLWLGPAKARAEMPDYYIRHIDRNEWYRITVNGPISAPEISETPLNERIGKYIGSIWCRVTQTSTETTHG